MNPETQRQTPISAAFRAGQPSDEVLGVLPRQVVVPQSLAEVSEVMAWANSEGLKVVPTGLGTKLDRGAPPKRCDILLDLSGLNRIVEHAAGDLTVTVQAGVRLSDLQGALAQARQFLALDPPVPGSIGGLIATADSGPRRLRYGGVRDLILGATFVRADGVVARGGGKVVKNVAGYDMPKLLTGSLGTLGVVVEATFRLHPLPAASSTVMVECSSPLEIGRRVRAILHSTLTPTCLDYFADEAGGALAVRFESSPRSVEAQAAVAGELWGDAARVLSGEAEAALWLGFEEVTATGGEDVQARQVSTTSDLLGLLDKAQRAASRAEVALSVRAHVGHGHALLRWHAPSADQALPLLQKARAEAEALDSNLVLWRAPMQVRREIDPWGAVGDALSLMRRVKAQFDPNGTLNPGRFVGGI